MAELIHTFMFFRDTMKIYHWRTTNYARHKASDALVQGLDTLIDQFVEVYIGKNPIPRPSFPRGEFRINLVNLDDEDAVTALQDFKDFLLNDLLPQLDGNMVNSDLINIRDEMLALANRTLYLFSLS